MTTAGSHDGRPLMSDPRPWQSCEDRLAARDFATAGLRSGAILMEEPLDEQAPGPEKDVPKIFATLAWGFDPEHWGAVGFSNEGVRNRLASELWSSDGLVLTMGTTGEETPVELRGRLLGLHRLGTMAIATEELVEPQRWQDHICDNGGEPKWPFGLPIREAEEFDDPPLRAELLPRLHKENLHRKLASNYELLTAEEARRVLALPRRRVERIWASVAADFAAHLTKPPKGPRPSPGQRVLSRSSGPAATYCFRLEGSAIALVSANIAPSWRQWTVYKVGFSNDPERRRRELNAYLPDEATLRWATFMAQWHADEINAWAMEQEVFRQLLSRSAAHVKGEILAARPSVLEASWSAAIGSARRPGGPVLVNAGSEEAILASEPS